MTDDLFSFAGLPLEPWPLFVGLVSRHPLNVVWNGMQQRCYNPKKQGFAYYGGRGVTVCDEWRKSSRAFISWALAHGWRPGLQLDRKDNDGPYAPWNCRFVTRSANQQNTRVTVFIEVGGKLVPLAKAARDSGISRQAARSRLLAGWSADDALSIPLRGKRPAPK